MKKTNKQAPSTPPPKRTQALPPFAQLDEKTGHLLLHCHVRPNKNETVFSLGNAADADANETVEVDLAAAPREGEANEEIVRALARDVLKIPKTQVSLRSGHKARDKVLEVRLGSGGVASVEAVVTALKLHCGCL